jgi:hypothetical protein
MKTFAKSMVAAGVLATTAAAAAAHQPAQNIGMRRGALRAAQQSVLEAFDYITKAQIDNRRDPGGHAGRARALLREASQELTTAAETANSNAP